MKVIRKYYRDGIEYRIKFAPTAGIYHNPSLGLISLSSNGSNWITIADKNLGATQVYNDGDTLSEANCGKYYQWGNNYGFPFTGATTTSHTKIDTSSYGPNNYYNSSTFRTVASGEGYSTTENADMRGDITNTNIARKGPCNDGYHIPSYSEMINLYNIGVSLSVWSDTSPSLFKLYLKNPLSGRLYSETGNSSIQGGGGARRTSTLLDIKKAYSIYHNISSIYYPGGPSGTYPTGYGCNIRPFANTPVQPDDSWTVLYQPA